MSLDIWNKLARPPADALKKINGGRLSGMTDIKPQWRYKVMTEVFGPCGEGWKFTVDKLWTEPGTDGQVMAFAQVSLFTKQGEAWSDPIPGVGGSMLVSKEKAGLHTSDEAFKMAITDALSTSMKMIGVAADIHMGQWDGSKYKDENTLAAAVAKADIKPMSGAKDNLTAEQIRKVDQVASKVTDWLESGSVEDAVMEKENAALEADETVYFWTLFDSKQKTAMKKEYDKLHKHVASQA